MCRRRRQGAFPERVCLRRPAVPDQRQALHAVCVTGQGRCSRSAPSLAGRHRDSCPRRQGGDRRAAFRPSGLGFSSGALRGQGCGESAPLRKVCPAWQAQAPCLGQGAAAHACMQARLDAGRSVGPWFGLKGRSATGIDTTRPLRTKYAEPFPAPAELPPRRIQHRKGLAKAPAPFLKSRSPRPGKRSSARPGRLLWVRRERGGLACRPAQRCSARQESGACRLRLLLSRRPWSGESSPQPRARPRPLSLLAISSPPLAWTRDEPASSRSGAPASLRREAPLCECPRIFDPCAHETLIRLCSRNSDPRALEF